MWLVGLEVRVANNRVHEGRQPALLQSANCNPDTCGHVTEEHGRREENDELEHIVTLLGNGFCHGAVNETFKRLKHFADVHKAEELEAVNSLILLHGQHWRQRCQDIDDKIAFEVFASSLREVPLLG